MKKDMRYQGVRSGDSLKKIKKRYARHKPTVIGEMIPQGYLPNEKVRKKRKPKKIFVFGSNMAGKLDSGSALTAKIKYRAKEGKKRGKTGNAFGIPIKDKKLKPLSPQRIHYYISQLFHFSYKHPNLKFVLSKKFVAESGYKEEQIIPMFKYFHVLKNVKLPKGWKKKLPR